jgi:hypothetical protein
MAVEGLQRTLLVGLGKAGAQVVDRLLARLEALFGPIGILAGIAVRAEGDAQAGLATVDDVLCVSPEASFDGWRADPSPGSPVPAPPWPAPSWDRDGTRAGTDQGGQVQAGQALEGMVADVLRRISRLAHLTTLAGRGLTLCYPDEVHLVLVADVSQPWVTHSLAAVADSLHESVYHTLACESRLTGLLLLPDTSATPSPQSQESNAPPQSTILPIYQSTNLPTYQSTTLPIYHPPTLPFSACFIASQTNEAGLVMGDAADLARHASHFLALLIGSPLGTATGEPAWEAGELPGPEGAPLASFGLAAVRWPGQELGRALSARWAQSLLAWLTAQAAGAEEEANAAAQLLVAAERVAPPLLVESLAGLMPGLPGHLADEAPDPPWPWQMVDVQKRLEAGAQGWEEAWPAARGVWEPALAEISQAWRAAASGWLAQHIGESEAGALAQARAHLAVLDELLEAFVEGVQAYVEEAEADLVAVERKMGAAAASLAGAVAAFPASPLETLLRWGLRPLGWLRFWAECRHAQALAREYAHLLRARLAAWQALLLYEAVLPVYREWAAWWARQVEAWEGCAHQVARARESAHLVAWPEQVQAALAIANGPWTMELIEELYREALAPDDLAPEVAWTRLGPLARWVQDGIDAQEIVRHLSDYAADALVAWVALPVDLALLRQFPDREALQNWLAAFIAQARPFWRYDETTLAEQARSRVRLTTWLLLPEADASKPVPEGQGGLADLCRAWPQPPILLESQSPEELVAVSVRHRLPFTTLSTPPADEATGESGDFDV